MKKFIVSASTTKSEFFHPALESFESAAYDAGYDLLIDGDDFESAVIILEASKDKDILPKLTCWFDTNSSGDDNIIYYQCKAEYPDISTEDLEYDDSAEYITDKWAKVAKFITWMMKNPIELDKWEED